MFISHKNRLYIVSLAVMLFITACDNRSAGPQQAQRLTQTAQSIEKSEMAVSIGTLSGRIIKRQNDYLLYDVRPRVDYDKGHIKSAQPASVSGLLSKESIENISTGREIFIYSNYSDKAAQLATLLRIQGIPAYYLKGGYSAWSSQMTDVSAYTTEGRDARELAKQQAISCWFEGDYVAEAGLTVKTSGTGGYVPPLEPVKAESEEDALGLGLDMGLGPEDLQKPEKDDLGLGLGLGLGPEDLQEPESECKDCTLKIGEGC